MVKSRLNRRGFIQKVTATTGATLAGSAIHLGSEPLAAVPRPEGAEPAKWRDLLSKPEFEVRTLIDVKVPMRDGVKLSANVFLPTKEGRWPVLLMRSPYGPKSGDQSIDQALYYAKRGYAYVHLDIRGRFDSEGVFYGHNFTEIGDGRDSLDWCGTQTWSNGNVGTIGMSDLGWLQWLAAPTGSPYLKTIMPQMAPADEYLYGMNYTGGAFFLTVNLHWAMGNSARASQSFIPYNWEDLLRHLPILTAEEAATGRTSECYRDWVRHSTYDDYWKQISNFGKFHKMNFPILQIGGWYDMHAKSEVANFEGIQREGTPPSALPRSVAREDLPPPLQHSAFARAP